MATLESINFVPYSADVSTDLINWTEESDSQSIKGLPQISWVGNTPWREANLWAVEEACARGKNLKSVWSSMTHIHAYAKWLEQEETNWWDFPARESERCLVRYRGSLMSSIRIGELASSTAQQRMAAVIRFYRWLKNSLLLSPKWPTWHEKTIGIRIVDAFGFERTMIMESTDLAIKNRKAIGISLEYGLLPVSTEDAKAISTFACERASEELALMLRLGFGTGMRFGTVADLKLKTLQRAVPDPTLPNYFCLAVGPGAHPPVHTKFGVTGQIWIHKDDLKAVTDYMFSTRRLKRQAQAGPEDKDQLFLTRYGTRYGSFGSDTSRALNVELGRLRKNGLAAGIPAFQDFRFHQTRCTYATELARAAIRHGGVKLAISIVKQALLHKDESTTLKYIKFADRSVAMAEAADTFTRMFLGLDQENVD
ncbi:site-specific integrase [Pseudomonas chlororaphis]|uniref:Site-specific recombinase, phage integrase family n=1 Tax=Pseudomonas chlororaphis O6 TaxID=1037915 RepID=A0AB33WUZ7_9PSED|nr:site-specific integrase [Pseudomonas chlororaphis]EIM17038.1 site-specific recombinase, phage integrase family [Pseudomonas chlororaphis O6]